ncbi:AraC family transcriptional regulator [uncultured Flavobacterium sp.]|uniref:helix-turn-helix domain-containing protein n=1 Tax=uncultured Flavobacterium sp. TaxID=165435 RepID=UPI0025EDB616|nr:helix-turn-helix domain-containing protein [uncultured Flavobacterium sp.]
MKKITTYSIQHHQKVFNLSSTKKDFFFIELGKNSLFNTEPRRSETYSISFLKEGEVISQAGLVKKRIKAPAIIALGPTVVRTIKETENSPKIEIIFFTDDYLLANRANVFYLMEFDFFENEEIHSFGLNEIQANKIERIFDLMKQTINEKNLHEQEIIRSYIFVLIHELNSFLQATKTSENHHLEKLPAIVVNFKNLLKKEYQNHHTVNFYADKLNITPKHLSEILKKQTGKTAGDWINESVILEAKVLLQNQSYSVAQISEFLNFSDQSVFGKFFKSNSGQTPLEYKKSIK